MHSLDWEHLQVVLQIARSGSLLAAERELGVSHSTLSRRLAALEKRCGEPIFERHGRAGLRPTETGLLVVEAAEAMQGEAQRLERQLLGAQARVDGTIRVSAPELLTQRHGAAFASFTNRYQGVVRELLSSNLTTDLGRREADIALRLSKDPPEHLVGRKLLRVEFALYGSRALVDEHNLPKDLGGLPWLAWERRFGARLTDAWMRRHAPNARVAWVVDSTTVLHTALRCGVGVAFISCAAGDADPDLVRLRPPEPGFEMDLWALTHPDLRRSARVRAFMSHMAEALEQWRDRYLGIT